jgi:hypothetical protein
MGAYNVSRISLRRGLAGAIFGIAALAGLGRAAREAAGAPGGVETAPGQTGSITGAVYYWPVWPLPRMAPDTGVPADPGAGGAVPLTPEQAPDSGALPQLAPEGGYAYPYPYPRRPVPAAGAVVALQGTSLSATVGRDGRFTISGVPVGVYYLLAATPPRPARPVPPPRLQPGTPEIAPDPAPVVPAMPGWQPAVRYNVVVQEPGAVVNVGALYLGSVYIYPRPLPSSQEQP